MGRYKFDKFLMRFSKDAQNAIIKDLVECCDICADDYDWNIIDIRIKKADKEQRHRFAVWKLRKECNLLEMSVG